MEMHIVETSNGSAKVIIKLTNAFPLLSPFTFCGIKHSNLFDFSFLIFLYLIFQF